MKFELVRTEPRFIVVRLIGSLDMTTVGEIEKEFLILTVDSGKNVIIDLTQVKFLASMGLSLFLHAAKGLQRRGLRLVLTNPQPLISEAIRASRLSSLLPVVQNEAEALRLFTVPEGA